MCQTLIQTKHSGILCMTTQLKKGAIMKPKPKIKKKRVFKCALCRKMKTHYGSKLYPHSKDLPIEVKVCRDCVEEMKLNKIKFIFKP